MTFDAIRAQFPHLAFSVYALEPGPAGTVQLEIIDEVGTIYPFAGPTLQAVLDAAFPAQPVPPVIDVFA